MSEQLIQTPGVFGENGNFLLERELGSGGMGGVYMGRDKMLDRPVAVKVMLRELGNDPDFVGKFKKEAQSAARLIHPNIAQIYSYGICDGMPYMAMELAAGGSLYSIMNANPGKTDVARVLKICQQVAQALQCASDQGCVHGDIKPENILLDANGNAKLVDFGLAGMQADTEEIWGTPYYISPEKVRKEPVDFRADMYSLGGTLYHALTGMAPFEGEDSIAVVKKRFEVIPEKPSELRPELTPAIDELVMKMLALNKEDRYPSFEALLAAFNAVLTSGLTNDPAAAKPASAATTTTAAPRKPAAGGTKRLTVRGRRTTLMKRPGATVKSAAVPTSPEPDNAEDTGIPPETAEADETDEDDAEGGGNLGVKIALVVGGIILAIGAVVGGLIWFRASGAAEQEEARQEQIVSGHGKLLDGIKKVVTEANSFADEFDAFSARATTECQRTTDDVAKLLSPEHAALLNPGPTQQLLDAIASTNDAPKAVEAPAPVAAPAAPAGTNAAPTAVTAPAAATNAVPAVAAATNAVPAVAAAPAPAAPAASAATTNAPLPSVIGEMNKLWGRAYECQACAVRVRHALRKIVAKSAEAEQYSEVNEANVKKLQELYDQLNTGLGEVKTSKDVETVKKGITFIKSTGDKIYKRTNEQMRLEKLASDRKARAEAQAAEEKAKAEAAATQHKEQVEKELAEVAAKFEGLATAQGIKMLNNWKSNIRQFEEMKTPDIGSVSTAEGQLEVNNQIRKLKMMQSVHELLVKELPKGKFEFKSGKLKGYKCARATESDVEFRSVKGGKTYRRSWVTFFEQNYDYVFRFINFYVYNGRENVGLSQNKAAEALVGSALMFKYFYADQDTAPGRAETLAKKAVEVFPHFHKVASMVFPEIDFGSAPDTSEE